MTNAEAEQIIDNLETPDMMTWRMVYKLVENTRSTMVKGGLETQQLLMPLEKEVRALRSPQRIRH